MTPLNRFILFINERERVRKLKDAGAKRPWTYDQILHSWRFCNVDREHDTQTVWIRKNIREPFKNDSRLWFNLALARVVNWSETLAEIGYVKEYTPGTFKRVLNGRREEGHKVWTGAYIVSTNGHKMNKADYFADLVLQPLWETCRLINGRKPFTSVRQFTEMLMTHNGFSDFMANQVATDFKRSPQLSDATDWSTYVLAGPGTLRGLNRLESKDPKAPRRKSTVNDAMLDLRGDLIEYYMYKTPWSFNPEKVFKDLNNLTNCLCEFDKYERVRNSEGQPRSRYTPS